MQLILHPLPADTIPSQLTQLVAANIAAGGMQLVDSYTHPIAWLAATVTPSLPTTNPFQYYEHNMNITTVV